jgi:hypothetical protein
MGARSKLRSAPIGTCCVGIGTASNYASFSICRWRPYALGVVGDVKGWASSEQCRPMLIVGCGIVIPVIERRKAYAAQRQDLSPAIDTQVM